MNLRPRTKIAVAAVVAFIAVGGGLAAWTLGGSNSPEPPTVKESAKASVSDEFFRTELRKMLAQVPDWAITDSDPTILHPCAGDWSSDATGWSGGSFDIRTPGERPSVWSDEVGFPSAAQASDAAALLVENLASCTSAAWRTQPIAQTGAVLAYSADGVVWIQQKGATVGTLQVPTTGEPPPHGVQVEVANLIRSSIG